MRLHLATGPEWIDLPTGQRVLAEPHDTLISQAAFAEAAAEVRPLQDAAEEAKAAGAPLDPRGRNGANAAWVSARQWVALIEATARYAIVSWEGINGPDGEPLAVSPEAVAAFARHPDLGPVWYMAYKQPAAAVDAEGNGSARFSNGASPATPNRARDASTGPNGLAPDEATRSSVQDARAA